MSNSKTPDSGSNFLRTIIESDLESGKHSTVITRFPPEPNGYPHIGHAKSICLNFGLARDFGGRCHLRMDDTNPSTEDMEYVEALKQDVQWLGLSVRSTCARGHQWHKTGGAAHYPPGAGAVSIGDDV